MNRPAFAAAPAALLLAALLFASPARGAGAPRGGGAPDASLFARLEAFHGHACAGSLFGARLGAAAREALVAAGGKGRFEAEYFDLSCPVDGVQVSAGTTLGNRAIRVTDRDEHRLVLTAAGNGRRVEARPTVEAERKGLLSRELGKKAKALPEGSEERRRLEREVEAIFAWLKEAPEGDVVTVR
jgi:formylmethanofuran dehydrogenase subunit E